METKEKTTFEIMDDFAKYISKEINADNGEHIIMIYGNDKTSTTLLCGKGRDLIAAYASATHEKGFKSIVDAAAIAEKLVELAKKEEK